VADAFGLPLNKAAAYLKCAHGKGLLRRWRDGRRYEYILSVTGARKLAYFRDLAEAPEESWDSGPSTRPRVPQVFLWCAECQRGFYVPADQADQHACSCGRDFVEVDEEG